MKLTLGSLPVMERAGNSVSEAKGELSEAEATLDRLESDYLAGRLKTDVQIERYWGRYEFQSKKVERLREEIKAAESVPAWKETGRTYSEEWVTKGDEQKRVFLQRHAITVTVGSAEDGSRRVLVRVPEVAEIADETGLHVPEGCEWTSPEVEFILPARRVYTRKWLDRSIAAPLTPVASRRDGGLFMPSPFKRLHSSRSSAVLDSTRIRSDSS
ncbi:hypothetical protein [Streptomyces sp. BF23-19]|uniref:hypothetical protein n=1 Tax=unclassified Streptomyces TaxID=2593676 RepID=UPI0034E3F410